MFCPGNDGEIYGRSTYGVDPDTGNRGIDGTADDYGGGNIMISTASVLCTMQVKDQISDYDYAGHLLHDDSSEVPAL